MKRTIPLTVLAAVLGLVPVAVRGQDAPDTATDGADMASKWKTGDGGYWDFMMGELEKIGQLDPYGVTGQLPPGYLSVKWDWGTIRASSRYNNKRELGPVMPPIEMGDPKQISIDMGLEGYGGGHTFQMSYGITGMLDWYIEVPFTYMNVEFNPDPQVIDDKGNKVDPVLAKMLGVSDPKEYSGCDFNNGTLPMLGRPPVATEYHASWLLGDINTGFSWNVYRTPRYSIGLTPRVFFPTGHTPHPNRNLLYGTGPELETGIGGWAVGFTQGSDLRIFKYSWWLDIIASSEFSTSYAFAQDREYPTNFPKPSAAATALDAQAFPDLSHLSGTFEYLPGWSVDWTAQLQFSLANLGLGVGYGVSYGQEPELKADPAFVSMVEGLQLLGATSVEMVQLGAMLSLLPLVPAQLSFQYKKVVDGYNAIVFDDFYQITVKGYIPLFLLWED
jgi:hypothetical protein